MITYNDIYEAARKERYSDQIQSLNKSFVGDVAEYFRDKREMADKDDVSDSVLKTKKQLENARTLFKELILRRRKKILGLVLIASETGISKQDFDNMLPFEKELFEDLMRCVDSSEKKLEGLLTGGSEEKKNQMVVFVENVGELLGLGDDKLGPFEKGQIANIPKDVAKILIEDKKVEVLDE